MAAPSGMNQAGGPPPYGTNAPNIPHSGHHNDMQYVWTLVEELSGLLEHNREKWQELQAGLNRVQMRHGLEDREDGVDGAENGDEVQSASQMIESLSKKLLEVESRNVELDNAYQDQARSNEMFQASMETMKAVLHKYVNEQQQATAALHTHYNELLSQSRNETLQTQLTHQAWQASLSRVSEYVRLAHKEQSDQSLPYRKRIAALKEENRLLRARAGWDPPSDSDDDNDLQFEGQA